MVVWNQSSDILSGVRGCSKWALEGMCHLVVSKHAWVDNVCATSIDLKLYDFSWTSALEAGPCNHGESWLKLLLWMVLPAFLDFEYWKCMYIYIWIYMASNNHSMTITYHLQTRVWNSTCSILLDQTKSKPHKGLHVMSSQPANSWNNPAVLWYWLFLSAFLYCVRLFQWAKQCLWKKIPSSLGIDRGSIDLTQKPHESL